MLRLHVEVLDDEIREHRRELQRRQHAGLHVVGVVAPREVLDAVRRNWNAAVPLAVLSAAAARRNGRASAVARRERAGAASAAESWERSPRGRCATSGCEPLRPPRHPQRPRRPAPQHRRPRDRRRAAASTSTTGCSTPARRASARGVGCCPTRRTAGRRGHRDRRSAIGLRRGRRRRRLLATRLRLVHPHHAVVVVRNGAEVARRVAVHEGERVHARHAPLRHLRQLPVREERKLAEQNRIEIGVLRRAAAVRVHQRLRFVQIVDDRRMRGEVPIGDRAHRHLREVDVAIVVVVHVLAPVRELPTRAAAPAAARRRIGREVEAAIEPIDVAIAPVRLGGGRDRHDDVVPDLIDQRRRLSHEAIGELHQHFRRTRFAAVQAAHQVIVRLRILDELLHLRIGESARVGELRQVRPVLREVLEVVFRRHPDDDELASFVRLADRLDLHARRRLRQGAIVLQDVGVVGELRRRADVVAEHVLRRGNPRHERQMVDERAAEFRRSRPVGVEFGEFRVLLLLGIARLGHGLLRGQRGDGKHGCERAEHGGPQDADVQAVHHRKGGLIEVGSVQRGTPGRGRRAFVPTSYRTQQRWTR